MTEIEEEFQDAAPRRRRPKPGPGRRVDIVELPVPLAEKPSQARPFDQDRWLGEPPWRDDAQVRTWERAHGHDVRLKCYVEYGCQAIEYESDAREQRIVELEAELRRVRDGVDDPWQTTRPTMRATCTPGCNWLQTRVHAEGCEVGRES